jgi:cytochrome c
MDSHEFTKIAGAVLAALLMIFVPKTIIEMRAQHAGGKPGYTLPEAAPASKAAAAPAKEAAPPKEAAAPAKEAAAPAKDTGAKTEVAAPAAKEAAAPAAKEAPAAAAGGGAAEVVGLLSKAGADNGKANFKKCAACHTSEKGKPKAIGPNLWGVVNRPKASFEGFEYSAAMKGKGGNWTFEDLAQFIANPKGFVPGTKMVFNGLAAPDAADVIAYLATLADTPVALPK